MFNLQTQLKFNSVITVFLLLVLAPVLAWLSTTFVLQSDWTKTGRHSLSEASIAVVSKLTEPLMVTAYASDKKPALRRLIERFVGRYQRARPDITLRFVDPARIPKEARNLGVKVDGELVLRYQGRSEHVYTDSEQAFTNAIQRLIKGAERWVATLEGHGERDPLGKSPYDMNEWAQQLAGRGIRTQPVNLVDTPVIPDNTAVLVIASPRVPLSAVEITRLLAYLERGGNLLWLREPGEHSGLHALADYLAIRFPDGTVIDTSARLPGINSQTIAVLTQRRYQQHPITEDFSYITYFPQTAMIEIAQQSNWLAKTLLTTGDLTWLETGGLNGEVKFNEGADRRGPLTIGVSLERRLENHLMNGERSINQRVVVIGDGDFLSNKYIHNSGNLELAMRLLTWLSGDDDFIAIPARLATDPGLNMEGALMGGIGIFYLVLLPALLFAIGARIWWRRRRL